MSSEKWLDSAHSSSLTLAAQSKPIPRHAPLCYLRVHSRPSVISEFHALLASQLNANIFVTVILSGPLNTMRSLPEIEHSPILRPLSWIACILDGSAFLCACIMRLRLFYLQRRERATKFGEDFYISRRLKYGDSSLCLRAPTILIFSALFLFAVQLVGFIISLYNQPGHYPAGPVSWGPWETGIVWMTLGASLAYIISTTMMALSLGRHRNAIVLFDLQATQNTV